MPATIATMMMMTNTATPANARTIHVMSVSLLRLGGLELPQEFRDPSLLVGPEDRLQLGLVEPDPVPPRAAVDVDGLYGQQPHCRGAAHAFPLAGAAGVGPRQR